MTRGCINESKPFSFASTSAHEILWSRKVLLEILQEVRARLEQGIRRQLTGLQGFVVRPIYNSMTPLHVELSLGTEVYTLALLKDGDISLNHGSSSNMDVRIESDPETFMSLFKNPSTELFKELERTHQIRITSLTRKGRDAEGYIRRYLTS